jgi:CheY-like chemotaxis protein
LELIKDNPVQGMLLDIALGTGINGIELGKKIKSSQQYEDAPMIAVTAYTRGKLGNIEEEGFTGYLQKPYSSEQLRALLETQNFRKKKLII